MLEKAFFAKWPDIEKGLSCHWFGEFKYLVETQDHFLNVMSIASHVSRSLPSSPSECHLISMLISFE